MNTIIPIKNHTIEILSAYSNLSHRINYIITQVIFKLALIALLLIPF